MLTSEEIISLIESDKWMMEILETVKLLDQPDWWVCAGFVRSKIWDVLHQFEQRTPMPDIDVIYFDPSNIDEQEEKRLEEKLQEMLPTIPWSVKNEARMHLRNSFSPYRSSVDAISKFPETATALGVKLDECNNLLLSAPHGIDDLANLEVRPTPYFAASDERMSKYINRVRKKNWTTIWSNVSVYYSEG
ncbi:nucleotidyltransferase family protein [Robertmurraya kyonggiensis]